MAKKRIEVRIEIIEMDEYLCGKIGNVLDNLIEVRDKYQKEGYSDLEIVHEWAGLDCTMDCYLYGTRMETDKEYNRRMKKENKEREDKKINAAVKKGKEMDEMQKLLKKYPKIAKDQLESLKESKKSHYDGRE